MKKTLFAALFAALCCTLAAAEQKIGTVNVEKIFRAYYKTAQVEEQIKKQAQIFRDYLEKQSVRLRELQQEFSVQRDKAQNLALDKAEQDKAAAAMASVRKNILSLQADMESYAAEKNKYMRKFESDKRAEVMGEISSEVRRQSESRRLSLVLDISGRTLNETPAVVYANPALDLTDDVIAAINRGQPPRK